MVLVGLGVVTLVHHNQRRVGDPEIRVGEQVQEDLGDRKFRMSPKNVRDQFYVSHLMNEDQDLVARDLLAPPVRTPVVHPIRPAVGAHAQTCAPPDVLALLIHLSTNQSSVCRSCDLSWLIR